MSLPYELVYFDNMSEELSDIKDFLKHQGVTVCQDKLRKDALTFGYYYRITRAKIEIKQASHLTSKYNVVALVICEIKTDEPETLLIKLICSQKEVHLGKQVFELAEAKAKELNIKKLVVHSLCERKLIKWYESLGFSKVTVIYLRDDIPKVEIMYKNI